MGRPDIASSVTIGGLLRLSIGWSERVSFTDSRLWSTPIEGLEPTLGDIDRHLIADRLTLFNREVDPVTGSGIGIGEEGRRFLGVSSIDSETDIGSNDGVGSRKVAPSMEIFAKPRLEESDR